MEDPVPTSFNVTEGFSTCTASCHESANDSTCNVGFYSCRCGAPVCASCAVVCPACDELKCRTCAAALGGAGAAMCTCCGRSFFCKEVRRGKL